MVVVILVNRYLAKFLVSGDIYSVTGREIKASMQSCSNLLNFRTDFLECHKATNPDSLTTQMSDSLVICGTYGTSLSPGVHKICDEARNENIVWFDESAQGLWFETLAPSLAKRDWLRSGYSKFEWMGVRENATPDRPWIMIRTQNVEGFLTSLWQVRDHHLVYVLPAILLLIFLIGLWLVRAVLEPVKHLESSIKALTPESLIASKEISAQHTEFATITLLYKDMCLRLDESFRRVRDFTGHASHELKTPLTILRGTAQRLLTELPTGSQVQILAMNMAEEVERLIKISEQLLLLSRADADAFVLERKFFNLSEFVDQLADDALVFEKSLQIHKSIDADVVWLCDAVLVKQLVHNLYTNAVKYNVPHGSITFELRRQESGLQLQISNPSAGVVRELKERAFDRFYRGDGAHTRVVDGLGLGLSICLEIAKSHRGTLKLDVDPMNNVTLTLRAPLRF